LGGDQVHLQKASSFEVVSFVYSRQKEKEGTTWSGRKVPEIF
jgi:hypothetical protein